MSINIKDLTIKKDERGRLIEILRPEDIEEERFGQVLVTTIFPGFTKANHYHKRKTEWYCVVKGTGELTIRDNETKDEQKIKMSDDHMVLVKISPNSYHSIKNVGSEEVFLLVYVDEAFNPEDQDTYYEIV